MNSASIQDTRYNRVILAFLVAFIILGFQESVRGDTTYAPDKSGGSANAQSPGLSEANRIGTGNPTVESLKGSDPVPPVLKSSVVPPLPAGDSQAPQAQAGIDRKLWIQNVLLKIDRMRNDAEAQIKKADASIRAGQSLLSQAQAKGNAKVETTVRRTIEQAQEVRNKNELNKVRAEEAIARVRNLLAKMSNENIPVQAVVSQVSGTVVLEDRNGKFASLNANRTYLEPGDTIQTLHDSRAEFQMMEGAATVTMGPDTKLHVTGDGLERETLEIIEGEMRGLKAKVAHFSKKFEVRTPSAVTSVRSTEFLVKVAPDQSSEILLIEGKLEVQPLNGNKPVSLEAGQRLRVPKTGAVPEPVAVDLSTVNRWWENN